jgi:hypothetical protein
VDWATVTSVAITGAVGIAGVAGTVIAAKIAGKSAMESVKLSISAEDRRARLNDKRRVYAEGMTAFHYAVVLWKTAKDPEDADPDAASLAAARRDAGSRGNAVIFIAPPQVADLAHAALDRLDAFRKDACDEADLDAVADDWYNAMADDLADEDRTAQ